MIRNIIRVDDVTTLTGLVLKILHSKYVAVDTETTGLDPLTSELRLIQLMPFPDNPSDIFNCYIIDLHQWEGEDKVDLIDLLYTFAQEDVIKIAHNAKFDIKFITQKLMEPFSIARTAGWFCTEIASRLVSAGNLAHKHNLKAVAQRHLGITVDKELQTSDWSQEILSKEQIEYAANDVFVLYDLYNVLTQELIAQDQGRVTLLEMDAMITIAEAELAGIPLDVGRWRSLLDTKVQRRDELKSKVEQMLQPGVDWTDRNPDKKGTRPTKPKKGFKKPIKPKKPATTELCNSEVSQAYEQSLVIYNEAMNVHEKQMSCFDSELKKWSDCFSEWKQLPDEVIPDVNLNSPKQVKTALVNIGVELGQRNTNEKELLALLQELEKKQPKTNRQVEIINALLEYRGAEKSVTSYGENILEAIGVDGRIHPSFRQLGAGQTGRMSCSDPNMQQVPRDSEHRRCIKAPNGRKLVIADYPQIELRIMAQLSGDRNFVNDFNSGLDMHKQGVVRFNGVPYDQVTKSQRQDAKAVNFHVIFGGGEYSLATRIKKTPEEAKSLLNGYFRAYPGNKAFMDRAAKQAVDKGFSRTMSGRLIRFDVEAARAEGNYGLLSGISRNGLNCPIQGTAADMFKRSVHLVGSRLWGTGAHIINFIHDEMVVECDEKIADWVSSIVKGSMEEAAKEYLSLVGCNVDVLIADEWIKE